MKRTFSTGVARLATGLAAATLAQADSLVVEVDGLRDAQGHVRVSLCADAAGRFPGGCSTFAGSAQAAAGRLEVRIEGLPAGRYALQVFHDANGNQVAEIPPEGFAFGNNAAWPTTFNAAAVVVKGTTRTAVRMQYAAGEAR